MRAHLLCLLISLFPASIYAAVVQQEMRPGIGANADYMAGARGKPAVLLLHGFLQTRDFQTVASLARSDAEAAEAQGIAPYCKRYEIGKVRNAVQAVRMVARLPSLAPSSMGFF
mgnify:CR=1 FL=1